MDTTSYGAIYRPQELTSFDSLFAYTLSNSTRNFMPKSVSLENNMEAASPFALRKTNPGRHFFRETSISNRWVHSPDTSTQGQI